MLLTVTMAGEFSLCATPLKKIVFRNFRGKKVILAFYTADWLSVCGNQMSPYNEILSIFQKYKADVVCVSVAGKWCHLAFIENRKSRLPFLSRLGDNVRYLSM